MSKAISGNIIPIYTVNTQWCC